MKEKIERYVNNLNEDALKQAIIMLITNPDNREHLMKCAEEFDAMF